jgi:hypothetical protein
MFSFKNVNIPVGNTLTFILDPNIRVTVVSDNYVSYNGKKMSLSGLTLLLVSEDGKIRKSIRGTKYWKFDNKILTEIIRNS